MKKSGLIFLLLSFCFLLNSCAKLGPQPDPNGRITPSPVSKKNVAYNAVLTDPIIKKDFRNLAAEARKSRLTKQDGVTYLSNADINKLNNLSAVLLDRLENHYHISQSKHKMHIFLGRNQQDSCFTYYDSNQSNIGKDCHDFSQKSCSLCNDFVKNIQGRNSRIMNFRWQDSDVTLLVERFRLRNNDPVYLGLIIVD